MKTNKYATREQFLAMVNTKREQLAKAERNAVMSERERILTNMNDLILGVALTMFEIVDDTRNEIRALRQELSEEKKVTLQ